MTTSKSDPPTPNPMDAFDTAIDLERPIDRRSTLPPIVSDKEPTRARRPTPQRARTPIPLPVEEEPFDSDPGTVLVRRYSFVDLPSGTVVDETYEIDAKIGAGAMGEVYAARHLQLGKRVAIKVIGERLSEDPAAIERFTMEAKMLARIQHPAIVAVDHVGALADGRAYFSMEFLHGESLFDRLQRGRLQLSDALRVLDQMARGLEAAHAQGVVHRDLKPENTFLVHVPGEAPIIKLLDFGLGKLRGGVDRRAERTQSGAAIGTPMYMSPEQMRGPEVDHRTDVYALGCVAYELVLGSPPFPHAGTAPELYAAHLHLAPPLPRSIWPEIPPQLDLVLFAMLAKDPAHRPTLAQFRAVLAAVQSVPSQRAQTEYVRVESPKAPQTAKIVTIALATLVVGLALGRVLTKSTKSTQLPREAAEHVDMPAPAAPVAGVVAPTAPPPHAPVSTARPAPAIKSPLPTAVTKSPLAAAATKSPQCQVMGPNMDPYSPLPPCKSTDLPAEEAPFLGYLQVTSTPSAQFAVDGNDIGRRTPTKLTLVPGTHKITFTIGNARITYTAIVEAGKTQTLSKEFQVGATQPTLLEDRDALFLPEENP